MAVVTNQELFHSIDAKMELCRIGEIEQYHTNPISDPRKALSGPVTEACGNYFPFILRIS